MVLLVLLAPLVNVENVEKLVPKVLKEHQAQEVKLDLLESKEKRVMQVKLDLKVVKDIVDTLVYKVYLDHR